MSLSPQTKPRRRAHSSASQTDLHPDAGELHCDVTQLSSQHWVVTLDDGRCMEFTGPGAASTAQALAVAINGTGPSATRSQNNAAIDACSPSPQQDQLGRLLAQLKHDSPHVLPSATRGPHRLGIIGEGPLANALHAALAPSARITQYQECLAPVASRIAVTKAQQRRERRLLHWTESSHNDHELVLIATTRKQPEPAVAWLLARRGIPHLVVTADQDISQVGQLVVPGVTACLICHPGPPVQRLVRGRLACAPAHPGDDELAWCVTQAKRVVDSFCHEGTLWPTSRWSGAVVPSRAVDPQCPACSIHHPDKASTRSSVHALIPAHDASTPRGGGQRVRPAA